MTAHDGSMPDLIGLLAVLILVAFNGFFVAAEFALVSVRRSRVSELAAAGSGSALALQRAIESLDAYLAATQLGITIASLALGWVGEPALAHLIEPLLAFLPESLANAGSHGISAVFAFSVITAFHIVFGELAPKSLALQRSEGVALGVVRPLAFFLVVFKPAIMLLNFLGNLVLRTVGLHPGTGEASFHSQAELKLLVTESHEAGMLDKAEHQLVSRVFSIGERQISDIMTPRIDVDWLDADDTHEEMLKSVRECRHEQLLVARGSIDEPIGMVIKRDLLDQVLSGKAIDPLAVMVQPLVLHEKTPVFRVLDKFKASPVRLALVVDEYGTLEGIVTQTDLLEAITGDLPRTDGSTPDIVTDTDGALLIEGTTPVYDAFERIGLKDRPEDADFHTFAGFALHVLERIPVVGDAFVYEGWRFAVTMMDAMRIQQIKAIKLA